MRPTIREVLTAYLSDLLIPLGSTPAKPDLDRLETTVKSFIDGFRQDLADFVRLQPDRMITRSNVLAWTEGLKSEWGQTTQFMKDIQDYDRSQANL